MPSSPKTPESDYGKRGRDWKGLRRYPQEGSISSTLTVRENNLSTASSAISRLLLATSISAADTSKDSN